MPARSADAATIAKIRAYASDSTKVRAEGQAVKYSLMTYDLTMDDICYAIIRWIDAGKRVKCVTLHSFGEMIGQSAFEMKPRINGMLFYIKVSFLSLDESGEYMLLLSAHPNY